MIGAFSGLLVCRAPSAIASTPTPALFRGLSSGLHSLVLAEQSNGSLSSSTLHVLSAAAKVSSKVDVLVTGQGAASCAKAVASVAGVGQVLVAEHESLHQQAAEAVSALLAAVQRKRSYSHLLAPASTFGKNILPRAAALLDCQPVSDVIGVVDADTYQRPAYAGNAVATVRYPGGTGLRMLTVRPTAFEAAATGQASAPVEALSEEELGAAAEAGCGVQVESEEVRKSERPQLGSARVVVCGGRALKSAENFKMLEELADAIGSGAVGASRAAVDAGYVPNDLQVGQTGKVVAPELYIGVGISGAIQHLAGMKDSRTIVAINTDAEAPIFQVADYGLVQDLFTAVPELTAAVKAAKAAA